MVVHPRMNEISTLLYDAERLSKEFPDAGLATLRKLWEVSVIELEKDII